MARLLPLRSIENINSMNNIIDDIFYNFDNLYSKKDYRNNLPLSNIKKNNNGFQVDIAAPGLSREDFKISVDNNILTIKSDTKESSESFIKKEFSYSKFERSFVLSKNVSTEQISARYDAGILSLSIPMEHKNKTLSINVD